MKVFLVSEYVEGGESSGVQVDEMKLVGPEDGFAVDYVCELCGKPFLTGQLVTWAAIDESAQSSIALHTTTCTNYTSCVIHLITTDEDEAKAKAREVAVE